MVCSAIGLADNETVICANKDPFSKSHITLFYSTLEKNKIIRGQIVMYWHNRNFRKDDKVALYFGNPLTNNTEQIFLHQPASGSGFIKTRVSPTRAIYELELSYVEQCTGNDSNFTRIVRKFSDDL